MKTLVVILIIALAGNSSSFGRTSALPETNQSSAGKSANAKAQVEQRGVGPKSRVKVRLRTHSEVKGYISAIDDTTFQVTDRKNGEVTTMTYDEVERVSGPGLPKVAKISIWAGAVAGAFMLTVVLIVASWHGN